MKRSLIVVSAILLFSTIFAKVYVDTMENIEKRLKYLNDYSQQKTDGKIVYKYTNQTGVYCEATRDIDKKEFVFNLKKEDVISFCKIIFLLLILFSIFKIKVF